MLYSNKFYKCHTVYKKVKLICSEHIVNIYMYSFLYNETFPVLVVQASYKSYRYQTVYKKMKFI